MENLPTRNNNPGNLRDVTTGEFRKFNSPDEGFSALMNDLQGKITGNTRTGLNGSSTLADFSGVYAPKGDNNDPAQYTANLANHLGVRPDTKLSELQSRIGEFAEAVARNEGWQGSYSNTPGVPMTGGLANVPGVSNTSEPSTSAQATLPTTASAASGNSFWDILKRGFSIGPFGSPGNVGQTSQLIGGASALGLIGSKAGPVVAGLGTLAATKGDVGKSLEVYNLAKGVQGAVSPQDSVVSQSTQPSTNFAEMLLSQPGMEQPTKYSKAISDAITSGLSATISGRNYLGSKEGEEGVAAAAMFGLAPEVDENGILKSDAAIQKTYDLVSGLDEKLIKALENDDGEGSINAMIAQAKEDAHGRNPRYEWENIDKDIEDMARAYHGEAKTSPEGRGYAVEDRKPLDYFQRIKRDMGVRTKFDVQSPPARQAAKKALYFAARKQVEQNTKNPELYNAAMQMEQRIINSRRALKLLNNKKGQANPSIIKDLLHGVGRQVGIYIGDRIGGPLGAMLGAMVGERIHRTINKHYGKTTFETPAMRTALAILGTEEPKAYQFLKEHLTKEGIQLPEDEEQVASLPNLLKDKKAPLLFKEGTKLDTEVEKAHESLSRSGMPASTLPALAKGRRPKAQPRRTS